MMPSDSGGYSGRRADGYIDPFAIPGAGLDADLIRRAAASFTSASTAVTTHGADVVSKWSGISASYRAPEAPSLIETMAPVKTGTESLSAVFLAASHALTAFADEVDRIKPELLQLTGEAEQFITSVVGTTAEGTKIFDYIPEFADRNNDLMRRVAAQVDALAHARDTCVAALSGLDSPMYWLSRGAGQGPAAPAALDTSIGTVLPFGTMKERSCQEAQAHGAQDAFRESVKGGLAMVGFNAHTRKAFDGDLALNSWRGAAASVYLVTTFVLPSPLTDPGEGAPDLLKTLAPRFRAQRGQVVEGFLGSEEAWKTNPGRALGGLEFNVGSVLMPGAEAGAGLKVLASGARGLRFGARATEMGAEGAADAARAGEASSGLGRVLRGTGAVSGRVGDLVAAMSRGAASSVSGSVTGFRDLLARVPKVSVRVEHMVTPDGMRVPTGVRLNINHDAASEAVSEAARSTQRGVGGDGGPQKQDSISSRDFGGPIDAALADKGPRIDRTAETVDSSSEPWKPQVSDGELVAKSGNIDVFGDMSPGGGRRLSSPTFGHQQDFSGAQHALAGPDGSTQGHLPHSDDHSTIESTEDRSAHGVEDSGRHDSPMEKDSLPPGESTDDVGATPKLRGLELVRAQLADPNTDPWRIPLLKGQEFNYLNHLEHGDNELRLVHVEAKQVTSSEGVVTNIREKIVIVDSYLKESEIISRKFTQLSRINIRSVQAYLREAVIKYPPGTRIAGTDEYIDGALILQIPPQIDPVPMEVLEYAAGLEPPVIIRDTLGYVY
ncbi:hypothetical protein PED38_06225 [Clavibacter sp. CT19]|uniref:hypothetical protein n=1 Tax=Clavibacter sp. CT19 TaxID=3018990 RepID=UPI0022EA531E|nr:hypothetical protein [Clavibacter sp. CT19]MDA3804386.1 hypothetical protein [Clavibacter sp. CT19]